MYYLQSKVAARPLWVVANTEVIAEEVVRTLVGSIALMCAVPITTILMAYIIKRPVVPDAAPIMPYPGGHHH